jgi:hypothetical protein
LKYGQVNVLLTFLDTSVFIKITVWSERIAM